MAKTDPIQKTKTKRHLRVDFTKDEIHAFGLESAREGQMADEADARKKNVSKQITSEVDGHKARVKNLQNKINNGYEYRDVPTEITKDLDKGTYVEKRLDSGEIIEDRVLSADERQLGMDV